MIKFGQDEITDIVVTSIMGHSGGGNIFPLNLSPSYRRAAKEIRDKKITVIAKSATRFERQGNYCWYAPWLCIKQVRVGGYIVGLHNSFGLTNKGVVTCAQTIRKAIENGYNVIPSYFVELSKGIDVALREAGEAVGIYSQILGTYFWALEYNASCPNSGESLEENEEYIVTVAKYFLHILPRGAILIVKLSPVHSIELALALQKAGVDVIHALNTFPHSTIFPDKVSPLSKYGGGGYSGEFMFEQAFKINSRLRAKLEIPMIMGCGISNSDHILKYYDMAGGKKNNSFAICSVIRTDPAKASTVLNIF